MKSFATKVLLATTVLAAVSVDMAHAQTANVSRSTAGITGLQVGTGLANAVSTSYITNDGKTLFVVKNNKVDASINATVKTQQDSLSKSGYQTVSLADTVVNIPSSSEVIIGPFPTSQFNTNGLVRVDLDNTTRVSATSFRVR